MSDIEKIMLDWNKPNAGRIYNYLIGANNNFRVDSEIGGELKKIAPFLPVQAKYVRWFLQKAIKTAAGLGFKQFIDFASGVPLNDHIHFNTPKGTKTVYSDIDFITVGFGKEIIGKNPNVKYLTCDAARPEILLNSKTVKSLFGANHKAAIGFNGICWFLPNEQIKHAMEVLYEWADKGSILYLTDYDSGEMTENFQKISKIYDDINQTIYMRPMGELIDIVKPWRLEEPGFLHPEKWYNCPSSITEKIIEFFGGNGVFGGFLKKQ